MRFDDDYGVLGSYLSEFSVEAPPAALGGYGFGAAVTGTLYGANEMSRSGLYPPATLAREAGFVSAVKAGVLQGWLRAVNRTSTPNSGRWDSATKLAWENYALLYDFAEKSAIGPSEKQATDAAGRKSVVTDTSYIWAHTSALDRLKQRAEAAATTPAPTPKTTAPTTTAPKPVTAATKTIAQPTSEVQSILKRLGDKDPRLDDGKFGPTTKAKWEAAAKSRKLVPTITRGKDIYQVIVNERAFLSLKADADAKVAPAPTVVDETVVIPAAQMEDIVARVVGVPLGQKLSSDQILGYWTKMTTGAGLPSDILYSTRGYAVKKSAWMKIEPEALKVQRPQPAPGPVADKLTQDTDALVKASTASVTAATLRTAFKGVYAEKKDSAFNVPGGVAWGDELFEPLMRFANTPSDKRALWQNALPKLINSDKRSVKLLPPLAAAIKNAADAYSKAEAAEKTRYQGYTQVDAADLIGKINALGVSSKVFNKAGGAKELADAIITFSQEAKVSIPGGDTVRTDAKGGVFVKDEVLVAVAKKALEIKQRADVTQKFRDAMVSNALRDSSVKVKVLDLQKAWKDIVLGQQSGTAAAKLDAKRLAVLKAVGLSGSFDSATRTAYTDEAQRTIIGDAVLQFEALVKQQLPPAAWDKDGLKIVADVRNQVWNDYLNKAVTKENGSMMLAMPAALAKLVQAGAANYDKNISVAQQREEKNAGQQRVLAAAVSKCTAIVSILDLQMALLIEAVAKHIKATGVTLTGVSNKATSDGLFQMSGYIFPTDYSIPSDMWDSFLKQVGLVVVSGREPVRAWANANYIYLPPDLAKRVSEAAGAYIAAKGMPQVQVVKFNHPSLVLAKAPPPKKSEVDFMADQKAADAAAKAAADAAAKRAAEEKAAADARRRAEEAARAAEAAKAAGDRAAAEKAAAEAQRLVEEARQHAADAQAAAAAQAAANEAARSAQASVITPTQESAGGAAAGGAAQGGGAQITGPTINITAPGPVAQAGFDPTVTLLGGGALALLALLVSKKPEKSSRMDEQP